MARVVKQMKRAPQNLSLARRFIMTDPNKSIPVELNVGFIGSNLAKGGLFIFCRMFFVFSHWQRIDLLPACFTIDLPFKIQYILLMFDRIYLTPRCP